MWRCLASLLVLLVLGSVAGCWSCGSRGAARHQAEGGVPSGGEASQAGAANSGGAGSGGQPGSATAGGPGGAGDRGTADLPGRGDDALCRTLALDFFDGQPFDDAKVAGLMPGDAIAIRRAGDEAHLCRAVAAPDDKLCDRTHEPLDCRMQRAVLLDSKRGLQDPAWGQTVSAVMSGAPGADATKVAAAREALRTGDVSRCPAEWAACPALASGDESRCPEEQKSTGECARDAVRLGLLRGGGLSALTAIPHEKVLAEAALGKGSCRWFVDEFLTTCQRATAHSVERTRRTPPVVGPPKDTRARPVVAPPQGLGGPAPAPGR